MSSFSSGKGHFGEQTGDAGLKKSYHSPGSSLNDQTGPIQTQLWDRKIYVDVRSLERDSKTGQTKIAVTGSDEQIAAATKFCSSLRPPITVTSVPAPGKQPKP